MGLTKQYLAYRPRDSFNIIASGRSNVNFLIYNNTESRYAVAAAAENVIVWDLRLGERVRTLRRGKQEVTALRASPDRENIAVGYADGVVEIFDLTQPPGEEETSVCSLALHKSAVSVLRFDREGMRLVSGSLDTEMVVVDVVEQAGQQRLTGHNAPITDAHFLQRLNEDNIVISSSKDTQIKFWNLTTSFCFKTIVDNRTEVWALALLGDLLVAGTGETAMNVYRLREKDPEMQTGTGAVENLTIDTVDTISAIGITNCGSIQRAGKGRTVSLVVDPVERVLSCHGTNDLIENFYFCTPEEARHRLGKRLKKIRKQQQKKEGEAMEEGDAAETEESLETQSKQLSLTDEVKRLESIRVKQKIKSIDVLLGNSELRVLVCCANNSLHLYSADAAFKVQKKRDSVQLLRSLTRQGHQSEVRSVCFSSDSLAVGSASAESFKIWNRESMQCLRTIATGYALCSTFVPGDRYVLLGLKTGKLLIIDVGTADIVEEIPAHESELWSISLLPDQKGCVTGSSDKSVKIWTFELVDSAETETEEGTTSAQATKVLSLLHRNTLHLEETVLSVRVSPDMKFLAVGLLDATVKVFFLDSFKFYLSLYGHKLPVLCLDISYDSTLIATGSADRNVKIWGLDFGDCHRSLFAHDDSVMSLQFIPKTHMFFTCGKDGNVKQWDGDTFDRIITLPGHIGEAYSLAVSPNGRFVISCGSDRTLRLFERTEEPLVLQDVQEEEREELENQKLATGEESAAPMLPGLKLPSRKTVGSERAVESILECLEICKNFEEEAQEEKPELHPLMRALNAHTVEDFLLATLARIRSSDMEEALLLLPFCNATELLQRLPVLIEKRSDEIELIAKVCVFLFKVHMKPIMSTGSLKLVLFRLVKLLNTEVDELRDTIGLNLYSMKIIQKEIEEKDGVELFFEASQESKKHEKKRREAVKRTIIQMR